VSTIVRKYNGRTVTKEELDNLLPPKKDWLEAPPMVSDTYSEHDPLISEGCGVMKSQVKETRKVLDAHKIPGVAVLDSGQMRFTSRRARRDWLRIRGLNDQDAGYSD